MAWIGVPVRGDAEQGFEHEIDLAVVLIEQPLEDQDRDEGGHRIGQDQQQPVERFEAQMRPLQDRRQQQAQRKGEADREQGEADGPHEDRGHRLTDALGVEHLVEVGRADPDGPARRHGFARLIAIETDRLIRCQLTPIDG